MEKKILGLMIAFFVIYLFISDGTLLAAPYYEGKVITIIVGYAPGGGYDRMARMLAKHLPKYIPGKPTILVQNMPGADSMIAANHIYNLAKPDGQTIGTINRGLPFVQILKGEGVRFDITKFSWIGSAAVEGTVLCLRTDLPYKTLDDLRKAKSPIMIGTTGPADSGGQFSLLLKEFLSLNFKMITYPSNADIMLAIERKEVDGRGGSYSPLKLLIERGVLIPFLRGRVPEPGIENLPVDEDFTTDKIGKILMAMRSAPDSIGRPYVAPPGTPVEVMKILKDAFAKVAKDSELKEDSKKFMMNVEYVSAEETLKVLNYLFNQPDDIVKEFSKFIKF